MKMISKEIIQSNEDDFKRVIQLRNQQGGNQRRFKKTLSNRTPHWCSASRGGGKEPPERKRYFYHISQKYFQFVTHFQLQGY